MAVQRTVRTRGTLNYEYTNPATYSTKTTITRDQWIVVLDDWVDSWMRLQTDVRIRMEELPGELHFYVDPQSLFELKAEETAGGLRHIMRLADGSLGFRNTHAYLTNWYEHSNGSRVEYEASDDYLILRQLPDPHASAMK